MRALQFLGYSYLRTEELASETTVDCSTLVSQAHWEGALIGVPFTAEGQRKAASGLSIRSVEEALPGDVLVKYPSLEDSPDKQWNHVGIYLGCDTAGSRWLIESAGGVGVRLSRVEGFGSRGGIKRFITSEDEVLQESARHALALAPRVPKFGRLGVNQYCVSGAPRRQHHGVDIYVPKDTVVKATIGGIATVLHDLVERVDGFEIRSEDGTACRYMMLECNTALDRQAVKPGTILGKVREPATESDIVYSDAFKGRSHLHLEFRVPVGYKIDAGNSLTDGSWVYLNHLYLSKLGKLPLPFLLDEEAR
jgi:hypothetical protein